MVQFYLLPPPPPPSNPWDKSSPSGPGVGNCLKRFCPGGRRVGQIENINFLLFRLSVDTKALDHVEKTAYFQEKSLEFVNREQYSLKIKICIRRYVNYSLLNKCAFDAYSNGWRYQKKRNIF